MFPVLHTGAQRSVHRFLTRNDPIFLTRMDWQYYVTEMVMSPLPSAKISNPIGGQAIRQNFSTLYFKMPSLLLQLGLIRVDANQRDWSVSMEISR